MRRALRMGKWKAVIHSWKKDRLQLFDLEADLGESTDLAAEHLDLVATLRSKMDEAHVESALWNLESNGFNLEAACAATGIEYMPQKKGESKE